MKNKILAALTIFLFSAVAFTGCKKSSDDDTTATCSDGIQNQNETAIDCGGPCTACPTCADGLQNQGETGVDCGGPCSACPAFTASVAGTPFAADTFYVDKITGSGTTGYRVYGRNKTTNANIDMYLNAVNTQLTITTGVEYTLSPLTTGLSVMTFTYRDAGGTPWVALSAGKLKFTELTATKASGTFSFTGRFNNINKVIDAGIFINAPLD